MCNRHYLMWRKHGNALHADQKKTNNLPNGIHHRRGYLMESPVAKITRAVPRTDPSFEKSKRPHATLIVNHGLRDGSKRSRRQWMHRKLVGAKPGEIVHHVDGNPLNNDLANLHIFPSAREHAQAHRSLERIAYQLLAFGLVDFDPKTGLYRLNQSFAQSSKQLE